MHVDQPPLSNAPPRDLVRGGALVAIVAGAALRIAACLQRTSLGIDEARVAINVAERSFVGLVRPLDLDQAAPVPFLWAEHLAWWLGGMTDSSLRAFPLVCGIALLGLMWAVGRRLVGDREALVATVLAAVSVQLIVFSTELKQYGLDALVTICVLGLAWPVLQDPTSRQAWRRLTIGGAVALCCSQPAALVLAGVGVAVLGSRSVRAAPRWMHRGLIAFGVWTAVFGVLYRESYRSVAASAYMTRYWNGTFLAPRGPDFGPRLLSAIQLLLVTPLLDKDVPLMNWRVWMGVCLFGLGGAALRRRSKPLAVLLTAPFGVLLLAAVFKEYPIASRLTAFLVPLILLLYGAAFVAVADLFPARARRPVFFAALGVLLVVTSADVVNRLRSSYGFERGRDLVRDFRARASGEPVYVDARGIPAWLFYTTDWQAPDTARLAWATRLTNSTGPAFENGPSRGRPVSDEGDSLRDDFQGTTELMGLGSGAERLMGYPISDTGPDPGWARNEARRLRAVGQPYVWVFACHTFSAPGVLDSLLAAVRRDGGAVVFSETERDAVLYRLRF